MSDASHMDERRYGVGMLPQFPMARCSTCGHWSYLAAIDGICLSCSKDTDGDLDVT